MCDFCQGNKLPFNTTYHEIFIQKQLGKDMLVVVNKNNGCCPPFVDCCGKDMVNSVKSAFEIKYCPMCGRKIERNYEE